MGSSVTHGHNEYVRVLTIIPKTHYSMALNAPVASRSVAILEGGPLRRCVLRAPPLDQINHPINTVHDVQVMFDNDDSVAVPPQTQQYFDELVDIREGELVVV